MLGQQDNSSQNSPQIPDQSIDAVMAGDAPAGSPPPANNWDHPGDPISGQEPGNSVAPTVQPVSTVAPTIVPPASDSTPIDSPATTTPSTPSTPSAPATDLGDIKRQALNELTPLISKLDQTPDEKYRTLMMMIQASDDQSLLGSAYQAAQQISDEKTRAQALLDIINEINYFSQQAKQ